MKPLKRTVAVLLAACFFFAGTLAQPLGASAETLSSKAQVRKKALQKVPNATIKEIERDNEDGTTVYEVELFKGNKEYSIVYRASDAKILEYKWEKMAVSPQKSKSIISKSKCKKLALKQVKNGKIVRISRKSDDGIDVYKVKMTKGKKYYSLEYHARTGALLEYEYEVMGY